MSDGPVVLDASALLCFLFEEPGVERVEAVIAGSSIGTVNLAEVISKLADRGEDIDKTIADFGELNVTVVPFDQKQAEASGRMRATTRRAGLSLGDRACLALAAARGQRALTCDRHWLAVAAEAGVEVDLVR